MQTPDPRVFALSRDIRESARADSREFIFGGQASQGFLQGLAIGIVSRVIANGLGKGKRRV